MEGDDICILCACGYSPQGRGVEAGIRSYIARHHLSWRPVTVLPQHLEQELGERTTSWHGLIGFIKDSAVADLAHHQGLPVVSCAAGSFPLPRVLADERQLVDRALDHCLASGYAAIAVLPNRRLPGQSRYQTCIERCTERGIVCHVLSRAPRPESRMQAEALIADQLRHLPGPVAVFCQQDRTAAALRDLCRRHNLRVPEAIGIIGVDDDERICLLQEPALSSVVIPWPTIGEGLALELHRRLADPDGAETCIRVPVYRVQARTSTARLRKTDGLVDAALHWLDAHFTRPRAATDLATTLGVHHATLCRRLRAVTGTTAQQLIAERRLSLARTLLDEGALPVAEIARRCGYRSRHGLRALFVAVTGMPPPMGARHLKPGRSRSITPRRR